MALQCTNNTPTRVNTLILNSVTKSSFQIDHFRPKEFTECVSHMRLLSWLLMGSLTHTSLLTYRRDQIGQHGVSVHYHSQQSTHSMAMPVPHDASCHIAGNLRVNKSPSISHCFFI